MIVTLLKGETNNILSFLEFQVSMQNHFNRLTLKERICRDSELQSTKLLINVLKK